MISQFLMHRLNRSRLSGLAECRPPLLCESLCFSLTDLGAGLATVMKAHGKVTRLVFMSKARLVVGIDGALRYEGKL